MNHIIIGIIILVISIVIATGVKMATSKRFIIDPSVYQFNILFIQIFFPTQVYVLKMGKPFKVPTVP